MKVAIAPAAERELRDAVDYYRSAAGAATAARFLAAVDHAVALVLAHPALGTPVSPRTRAITLKGFPYWLLYSVEADTLTLRAAAHQRRRPQSWRERH
ncbi:type II toxin-antitoxin system RelE/ParE family toxin [Derxia lacustris]|uniref:type II toxin-antitoxin system RelE/ParE family toxin n=1 Tax=Derxia lacustris TaxID=764842 RepID=UPI0015945638|nr:type II toxin-antitoxin system RelE/ParE family toxin [Derxia lacustris]